jgi:hypothetical protein
MSKEPHNGQSSNRLNSVLAHRGGGGIQPRNCPVPRRCHWMAHPSSKGKRGSNYRQSRRKRGPPMSSARTGAVGTVIGAFVPLSPVVAFLIVIATRVKRDGIAPARLPGGSGWHQQFVNRSRRNVTRPVRRGDMRNGQSASLGFVDNRGCRWARPRAGLRHGSSNQPILAPNALGELEWSMSVGAGTGARRSGHCSSVRVRWPEGSLGDTNVALKSGGRRGRSSLTLPIASSAPRRKLRSPPFLRAWGSGPPKLTKTP